MEHKSNIVDRPSTDAAESPVAASRIVRGVLRLLDALDYRSLVEFPLPDGRRADVAAIGRQGAVVIVEVKSCLADFRADGKWPAYVGWCDAFYFAVDPVFPNSVLPETAGIIVADGFDGVVDRPAPMQALAPARRRALTLRFARTAAARLAQSTTDPLRPRPDGWR